MAVAWLPSSQPRTVPQYCNCNFFSALKKDPAYDDCYKVGAVAKQQPMQASKDFQERSGLH